MNKRRKFLLHLAWWVQAGCFPLQVSAANTWYVALTGNGADGTTWATAYTSLHAAVTAAGEGDLICLKSGTYPVTNQVDLSGKRDLTIRGGYAGTTPEPGVLTNAATILNRVTVYSRIFYGNAATVTVERLRIQGGYLNAAGSRGGALYFTGASAVTLRDCLVTNNQCYASAANEGGALYQDGGWLTVENSRFVKNALNKTNWDTQSRGGAASLRNTISLWSNVTFAANTVWTRHYDNHGGAVFLFGGQATLKGCVFSNNYSISEANGDAGPTRGGAVHADGVTALRVEDTLFTKNRLSVTSGGGVRQGGAIYLGGAAGKAVLSRCVFTTNGDGTEENGDIAITAGSLAMTNVVVVLSAGGSGLYLAGGTASVTHCTFATNVLYGINRAAGTLAVHNSIAWWNPSGGFNGANTVTFSCSQEVLEGTGNLVADPQFVDRAHFHLRARAGCYTNGFFSGGSWTTATNDSPLIDLADPASDYSREPHPYGFRANLGAYGNSATASKTYLEDPGVFTVLTTYAHPVLPLTTNSVRLRGQVLNAGGENPLAYLCWGALEGGTSTSGWAHVVNLGARGEWEFFTHDVTGLDPLAQYKYRAFVTNSTGYDWSESRTFGAAGPAVVTNTGVYRVQREAARLRGTVMSDGGSTPTIWFDYWEDGSAVTSSVAMGPRTATVPFFTKVSGLDVGTPYHYRIRASNDVGVSYSLVTDFTTLSAAPVGRYVTTVGAGILDGTSWTNAYVSLSDAMEDCTYAGDTIYLKHGTYSMNESLDISGFPGLTLDGGYAGTGAPGARTNAVTLFTRISGRNIRIMQGNATTVTLSRVTVANGYLAAGGNGLGLHLTGNSWLILTNCVVTNCYVPDGGGASLGGGIYQDGGRLDIRNSLFYGNTLNIRHAASRGGAIAALNVQVTVLDSVFRKNRTWTRHWSSYGAGLYLSGGSALVKDCRFESNWSDHDGNSDGPGPARGAGVYAELVRPLTVQDCVFQTNRIRTGGPSGERNGVALYVAGAGTTVVSRCVMTDNGGAGDLYKGIVFIGGGRVSLANLVLARSPGGDGLYMTAGTAGVVNCTLADSGSWGSLLLGGELVIRDSIAWGNTAGGISGGTVRYTDAQEPQVGEGNLVVNPLFADAVYYHLQSRGGNYDGGYFSGGIWSKSTDTSPCVDSGERTSDFSLEPKPNLRVNMGAYGNTPVASKSVQGGSVLVVR